RSHRRGGAEGCDQRREVSGRASEGKQQEIHRALTMTLEEYATAFTKLRVNTARSSSPHKPCMLLAVLDLAEAGALEKNEIRYLPNLLERYEAYFDIVRAETDHSNPYFPFFHLRGD